jgi:hypothetical protein
MDQKTYTQEQYNELEVELGVLYATNEKNFETYQDALTKINKLELQSQKLLMMLNAIVNYYHIYESDILDEAKQLIKETNN